MQGQYWVSSPMFTIYRTCKNPSLPIPISKNILVFLLPYKNIHMGKTVLCLLLCCASLSVFAQPRLPKNYYWQKLDNGLEVVVIENSRVPLTTIEIAVKNGAFTEGPEYSGLSHLFEHMFFKANRDYPDQQKFIGRVQELGAIWNGT